MMDRTWSDPMWDPLGSLEMAECNVCTASVEKRIRMQQAWQLWQAFLDTFHQYQDWLQGAEQMAAFPKSSHVLYADAKEELKKFEVLHRQVQERLGQLESLNRQYWRLVTKGIPVDFKANGTGLKARLRAMAQESNQRWDTLQKRIAAVHRRLKYFISQREEFEYERENIKMCLTEIDLRLTDVQHFSNGNTLQKMQELQTFQQHVQSSAEQMDWLLVLGERLIQRSEPQDAVRLEEELQEVSCYCQEVFNRVSCFQRRLISIRLVFEDEHLSDKDSDLESGCSSDLEEDEKQERRWTEANVLFSKGLCSSPQPGLKDPKLRSGSVDLEWDPSVDIGGSTSHDEDDSSYFSNGTGRSGIGYWEEISLQRPSHCRRHFTSPVCTRSKADAELELQVPLDSVEICDERSDCGLRTSSRETIPCFPVGPLDPHRNEHSQNIPDEPVARTGTCCQAEHFTFDQERIESWLGQTQSEHRQEVLRPQFDIPQQGSTQPDCCCPASPEETQSALAQTVPKSSDSYWDKRKSSCPRQSVPTSRAKRKLVRKRKARSTEEVTIAIQKSPITKEELLPLKRLRNLAPLVVVLVLLVVALLLSLRETPCYKANRYAWSFHLMLKYVNGPPPL
ncbi:nesprin-2 isoform X2 [Microcaecilia unicolor]|uniref:Nesprin-2-like isoform X2 n=1 Tax=Microcaecilia unicolor TaxID=1415580 RepID=A0A6P7ZQT5_9AMPH|nr:nesprin-2-like isoform X2 [Microcaecilia unicolor]